MTPSGLSCHLAASTQCQELDRYRHTGATTNLHTHTPEDCKQTLPKTTISLAIIF